MAVIVAALVAGQHTASEILAVVAIILTQLGIVVAVQRRATADVILCLVATALVSLAVVVL